MEMEFLKITFAAALASAGLTWWTVRRWMLRDFEKRKQLLLAAANEQAAATQENLRSAHRSAQLELEQLRVSVSAQVRAAVAAEKAAVARLEGTLKLAYEELDRLRAQSNPKPAVKRNLSNAFAQTEVMETR